MFVKVLSVWGECEKVGWLLKGLWGNKVFVW